MANHNPEANSVEDCIACLEIMTERGETSELRAFVKADQEHFKSLRGQDYHVSPEQHVSQFKAPDIW